MMIYAVEYIHHEVIFQKNQEEPMSEVSEKIREEFKKGDDIRDAGLTVPDDVERFVNIVYGDDPNWQVLDVYRLKNTEEKRLPVIISVHGGGWVYGDKERYQFYCMSLVKHGFAVVNFTYRLAPEFKFPANVEDTNLVVKWVLDHAEEYGFDKTNLFAVGDSAGAHNLGMYAAICTNPVYAEKFEFQVPADFSFKAIALNCGVYVIDAADELTNALMHDFLPEGGTEEEYRMISVPEHMTEKYPPVFLMTAAGDFLTTQAPLVEKELLKFQIPHVLHFYGDKDNILGHVFHLNMKKDIAHQCNEEECAFFKTFL